MNEDLNKVIENVKSKVQEVLDKTDADEIYRAFGVSKKTFKRAVGDLYKRNLITLSDSGIELRKKV